MVPCSAEEYETDHKQKNPKTVPCQVIRQKVIDVADLVQAKQLMINDSVKELEDTQPEKKACPGMGSCE